MTTSDLQHLRQRLMAWQREDVPDLLAECDVMIVRLELALRSAARNDKSEYRHHELRPFDGKQPHPGTIWRTPREIARRALQDPDLATLSDTGDDAA